MKGRTFPGFRLNPLEIQKPSKLVAIEQKKESVKNKHPIRQVPLPAEVKSNSPMAQYKADMKNKRREYLLEINEKDAFQEDQKIRTARKALTEQVKPSRFKNMSPIDGLSNMDYKPLSEEYKVELKNASIQNRKVREQKKYHDNIEKFVELYHSASSFIINKEQLDAAIEKTFINNSLTVLEFQMNPLSETTINTDIVARENSVINALVGFSEQGGVSTKELSEVRQSRNSAMDNSDGMAN